MKQVFQKTFGGLSKEYLFRQFFFGSLIAALILWGASNSKQGMTFGLLASVIVNVALYPYSRYVYESVVGFIFGDNVFFVNAILMLLVKIFTMAMCFALAFLIAPIGLAYLYYHHSKPQLN